MTSSNVGHSTSVVERENNIKLAAARHALSVHEARDTPRLTPFGIACCAAAAAIVLMDERHPNHARFAERYLGAAGQNDEEATDAQ